MLDAAAQEHWAQHGWLWLRGFLGAAEVEDLRRWTDEVAAWPEVPGRWMRYYERRGGAVDPAHRMLARIENFVPYHSGLAGVVTGPRLVGLLAELCGEPVVLFKDKINLKLPGGAGLAPLLLPDVQPRLRGRSARGLLRPQARVLPARVRAPARRRLRGARPPVQPGEPVRLGRHCRARERGHRLRFDSAPLDTRARERSTRSAPHRRCDGAPAPVLRRYGPRVHGARPPCLGRGDA